MNTPYFKISKQKLDDNVASFQNALIDLWSNSAFGYSVKTNSLPWILKYLKKKEIYAEVVSDEEYQLALKCGYDDSQIIFNGPIKGEDLFKRACKNGAFLNIDSKNDLKLLKKYYCENSKVGIRINIPPEIFDKNDIGYIDDGFRFGFSDESGELLKVFNYLTDVCKIRRFGLHLHCNSVTRSENVYIAIAKYACEIINKYNIDVSYIDIGGGFFGGVPQKTTAYEYILSIKNQLEQTVDIKNTKLIIEPGSAIIASAVDFVSSVLDVKDTAHSRIVTTDASRINLDPLWIKKSYMYSIIQENPLNLAQRQIICGYTCMDHDRLMILNNEPELQVGDKIVYHRVGAYSMTFGGMFIRYLPNVFVYDETKDEFTLVRKYASLDNYIGLNG